MLEELTKWDKDFNETSFIGYTDNIFVKLLTSVMLDELDTVRHFISDDIYNRFNEIIKRLKEKHLTQMYDELNVKNSRIEDISITNEEFIVKVRLNARYMDYYINSDTGNYVSGNNKSRIEKSYLLTYKKKRNYASSAGVMKCPGCGASIAVNDNGKCSYCNTIFNLEKYDYILCNIE